MFFLFNWFAKWRLKKRLREAKNAFRGMQVGIRELERLNDKIKNSYPELIKSEVSNYLNFP